MNQTRQATHLLASLAMPAEPAPQPPMFDFEDVTPAQCEAMDDTLLEGA